MRAWFLVFVTTTLFLPNIVFPEQDRPSSRTFSMPAPPVEIVSQGRFAARIAVPANASEPVRFAAEELQKYVREITGAVLPIDSADAGEHVPGNRVRIIVGESGRGEVDRLRGQPEDAYSIVAKGREIRLAGATPRATLYAVYDLLERLGCGFPRPGQSYLRQAIEAPGLQEETIPHRTTLSMPATDVLLKPAFSYPALLCFPLIRERSIREIDWMAKNRFNWVHLITNTDLGVWDREQVRAAIMPEIRKRGLHVQGIGHSFFAYLPPERFFAEHPEYFAMINGQRKREDTRGATLCVSNPDVVRVVSANMSAFLDVNPEIDIIDLWNNDGLGWCECPKCREMNGVAANSNEHYRSTTRGYLRFVNAVAQQVAKQHPDVRVNALAYGLNLPPDPETPPSPNVVVGVAPWDRVAYAGSDDYYTPISEPGPVNDYLRIALTGWAKQTKHLYIYDYYANRSEFFPIVDTLRRDYAWYLDRGIHMLSSETIFWDEFNLWAYGRLSWNPRTPLKAIINSFCPAAYRAAAEPMERFYLGLERGKWEWPNHRLELSAALDEAQQRAQATDDPTVVAKIRRLREVLASDPQRNWPHPHPPPELSN